MRQRIHFGASAKLQMVQMVADNMLAGIDGYTGTNGAITCTLHLHQEGENEQAPKIQEADYSSGGDLRGKEEHHLVLMLAPGEKRLEVDHSSGAATSLRCIKLTTCHPLPPNQCLHHRFHQISLYQSNAVYCNYKLCIFIFTFLLFINPSLSFR